MPDKFLQNAKHGHDHSELVFKVCVYRYRTVSSNSIQGRKSRGGQGDTSPQTVERGTVIRHVPQKIWRDFALVSAGQ